MRLLIRLRSINRSTLIVEVQRTTSVERNCFRHVITVDREFGGNFSTSFETRIARKIHEAFNSEKPTTIRRRWRIQRDTNGFGRMAPCKPGGSSTSGVFRGSASIQRSVKRATPPSFSFISNEARASPRKFTAPWILADGQKVPRIRSTFRDVSSHKRRVKRS